MSGKDISVQPARGDFKKFLSPIRCLESLQHGDTRTHFQIVNAFCRFGIGTKCTNPNICHDIVEVGFLTLQKQARENILFNLKGSLKRILNLFHIYCQLLPIKHMYCIILHIVYFSNPIHCSYCIMCFISFIYSVYDWIVYFSVPLLQVSFPPETIKS